MKTSIIITLILFAFNFDQIDSIFDLSYKRVTIQSIDESILENYYYIVFFDSAKKKKILLSKKESFNCINQLQLARKYYLHLNLLKSTEGLISFTGRLYQNDIYIDGKLIFSKKINVYSSTDLKGLCLLGK